MFGNLFRRGDFEREKMKKTELARRKVLNALEIVEGILDRLEKEYNAVTLEAEAHELLLEDLEEELRVNRSPRIENEVDRLVRESKRIEERLKNLEAYIEIFRDIKAGLVKTLDRIIVQEPINAQKLKGIVDSVIRDMPFILTTTDIRDLEISIKKLEGMIKVDRREIRESRRVTESGLGEKIRRVEELLNKNREVSQ